MPFYFFFIFFLLVDEAIEDPNTSINGPTLAVLWRAHDGPTLNTGLVVLRF